MDMMIIIGYDLFAKRLHESMVVFELVNGKVRTESGLAKRTKAQRSTIDWHYTRKVLMHSYGQAYGFTPEKEKDTGAQGDVLEDELEGHRSDSEELDGVGEGNNTTEEHAPEYGRLLDEIGAFLEANSGIISIADADSSAAGPSTPPVILLKAPNVSVNKVIDEIVRYTPYRIDTLEGIFNPVNINTPNIEIGNGSDQDRCQKLLYKKKGL